MSAIDWSKDEERIKLCAKIYDVRSKLKIMLGDKYQARLDQAKPYIRALAKAEGVPMLKSGMLLAARPKCHPALSMVILCAALEMEETEATK